MQVTEDKLKEHIKEVLSDKDFLQKLTAAPSVEEAAKLLAGREIELAPEDARELLALLRETPASEGEVPDEAMAQVAGGDSTGEKIFLFVYEKVVKKVAKKLIG